MSRNGGGGLTFIYAIARNVGVDEKQRRRRYLETTLDFDATPTTAAGIEEELSVQNCLRCALRRLEESHRSYIVLIDMQGFEFEAVAQIFGRSLATVKSMHSNALGMLREVLRDGYEPSQQNMTTNEMNKELSELLRACPGVEI